jgi:multicomponent Na+:H+ antiporter subunit G
MSPVALALVGLGSALILLAAVGVLRFPDVLTRANAASKATGLGLAVLLLGVAVEVGTPRGWTVLGLAVVLQLVTTPVAGHVLARAAYRSGAPLWEGTRSDDLRTYYRTHPRLRDEVRPPDHDPGPGADPTA